jgi:hypothetical protein
MLLTVKILFTPDSTEGVEGNQITAQKKIDGKIDGAKETTDTDISSK